MKNLTAAELGGPRSYFTNFDHRIVGRANDKEMLRRDVERNLKILLLFKSKIVCGASHLVTPFTYAILKDNPSLLRDSHIIPALRNDKDRFISIVEQKKDKSPAQFLDDNVPSVVRWDVVDNSSWFQQQFVDEFRRPESMIRQKLNPMTDTLLARVIGALEEDKILSRNKISAIAKLLQPEDKTVLLNYRELIYHISGARVVNCESALPQENYIDFNFERNRHSGALSEPQIAWKLFVELALQSLQARIIPLELLDNLTFDDIIQIRQPLLDSGFQQKYDNLLNAVYQDHSLIGNHQLISSHFLALIEGDICKTFDAVFDSEMPKFIKQKALAQSKELVMSSSSIALGVAGLVPGLSLAGVIGLMKDTPAFLVNLKGTFKSAKSLNSATDYIRNREKTVTDIISKQQFSDKAPLLEAVDFITASIAQKILV